MTIAAIGRPARWVPVALLCAACAAPATRVPVSPAGPGDIATGTASPAPTSPAVPAIQQWEALAGEHFRQSALALGQVSAASAGEDESGLWSGCRLLHDTNSIGLQSDLPSPDPGLTAELQRMIDDMNTATHACLRFVLGRDPADAANYREYLDRAVEHLRRAKLILTGLER